MEIEPSLPVSVTHDSPARSSKKHKSVGNDCPTDASVLEHLEPAEDLEMLEPPPPPTWGGKSFADAARAPQEAPPSPPASLYMGDDDDREFDDMDSLCDDDPPSGDYSGDKAALDGTPVVKISAEKYHSLFKPWRGALVLKLLGKSISFRLMEQRTNSL